MGVLHVIIRDERPEDIQAIAQVTAAAFATHPHSQQTEVFIISALRKAGALSVSLVAEVENRVVGHVAFSPITIDGQRCDWYGAGPVSVLPSLQRQGIGTALMNKGLDKLKSAGAKGCALVGDPPYYQRFGFRNFPDLILEGIPPEYFMALPFTNDPPRGLVEFHEAFKATC